MAGSNVAIARGQVTITTGTSTTTYKCDAIQIQVVAGQAMTQVMGQNMMYAVNPSGRFTFNTVATVAGDMLPMEWYTTDPSLTDVTVTIVAERFVGSVSTPISYTNGLTYVFSNCGFEAEAYDFSTNQVMQTGNTMFSTQAPEIILPASV